MHPLPSSLVSRDSLKDISDNLYLFGAYRFSHSRRLQRYSRGLGTFGREYFLSGSNAQYRKGRNRRRQFHRLFGERNWLEDGRCSLYR